MTSRDASASKKSVTDELKGNSLQFCAGWRDPRDLGEFYREFSGEFSRRTLEQLRTYSILSHTAVTAVTCADPAWMQSDSFYPAGTFCGLDQTLKTCFDTGDSGKLQLFIPLPKSFRI